MAFAAGLAVLALGSRLRSQMCTGVWSKGIAQLRNAGKAVDFIQLEEFIIDEFGEEHFLLRLKLCLKTSNWQVRTAILGQKNTPMRCFSW